MNQTQAVERLVEAADYAERIADQTKNAHKAIERAVAVYGVKGETRFNDGVQRVLRRQLEVRDGRKPRHAKQRLIRKDKHEKLLQHLYTKVMS